MTVTRVPARNPEPMPECDAECLSAAEVGVPEAGGMYATDPACSLHGDQLAAEHRGLDGRGTTHAADLPATAHTWGHLSVSLETDTDLDAGVPVKRSLCLLVDPEGDYVMPGRCKKPRGYEGACDWSATHGAFLGETRRAELETPSGRLPVRERGIC